MSAIDREDALEAILSKLAEREEPCPPWIYATIRKCLDDLPSLPSTEPLVHDGYYLCDKKPGACPSWERKGWTKCMSKHCHRTSRVEHALKLPDDGWIPIEDGLPEVSTEPYATSVDGIDEERFELHESERVLVACIAEGYTTYGIGVVIYDAINKTTEWAGSAFGDYDLAYPNYCKVIAWMPLPKPYEPKEDN